MSSLSQGHVNSMLKIAELLCLAGLHITFLVSDYTHGRLLRYSTVHSRFSRYPGFRFATISDGLPDDHPRAGERTIDVMMSLKVVGKSQFRELMESTDRLSSKGARRPVTCIIMDGVLIFAAEVGEEMGIPYIYFRTVGACSFWANFSISDVIDAGEVPLKAFEERENNVDGFAPGPTPTAATVDLICNGTQYIYSIEEKNIF